MKIERVIIILTGLLALVGVLLLINSSFQDDAEYVDVAAYEDARTRGDLPLLSPVLPSCATDIIVARGVDGVESVAFSCSDAAMREVFTAEVRSGFDWDVMTFEGGRMSLTRVHKDE